MDVRISPGGSFTHSFPTEWNAFAYVYEGEGVIGKAAVESQQAIVMDSGDYLQASASDKVRPLLDKSYRMHPVMPSDLQQSVVHLNTIVACSA